jgi:hypothetical protein
VCDIYLNSLESFAAHKEGKKHHKAVAKRNASALQQATRNNELRPVSLLLPTDQTIGITSSSYEQTDFDHDRAIQILEYFFKDVLRKTVTYKIGTQGPIHMTRYFVEVVIPSLPSTVVNTDGHQEVEIHNGERVVGEGTSKSSAKKDVAIKACQVLDKWQVLRTTIPKNLLYKPSHMF